VSHAGHRCKPPETGHGRGQETRRGTWAVLLERLGLPLPVAQGKVTLDTTSTVRATRYSYQVMFVIRPPTRILRWLTSSVDLCHKTGRRFQEASGAPCTERRSAVQSEFRPKR